ncbi:hypothetical protein DFH09DRAFT_1415288 [Mycena vulgaris]|nr:hypothetical protein DFH09DRAFT_1415288 [Mycena vulgaris]
MPDDVFLASPRKSPAHRRSTASLRPPADDDSNANGRFSLAHELAVAMMPEPSAGSKLLAEEFGIEFDEGAEGIDDPQPGAGHDDNAGDMSFASSDLSFAVERDGKEEGEKDGPLERPDFGDPAFAAPRVQTQEREERRRPAPDAMEVLAQDLASTDNFLAHLRRLDTDPHSSSSAPSGSGSAASGSEGGGQPALERLASDVIRRINDTARDREGQVRALLEYEREFRRIGGEVGGQDVLAQLDALPEDEDEGDVHPSVHESLGVLAEEREREEPRSRPAHLRALSQDWETDPDVERLGDTDADGEIDPAFDGRDPAFDSHSPTIPTHSPTLAASHSTFPNSHSSAATSTSPSTSTNPSVGGSALPAQLAALRVLTTTLVGALTAVSEHAQVNGAATADAGRKIRALRNRLGGWRAEWEGAERSRGRIEAWEGGAGNVGAESTTGGGEGGDASIPTTPAPTRGAKRVDGRAVVAEHLRAFEGALEEAARKTKAIMAT